MEEHLKILENCLSAFELTKKALLKSIKDSLGSIIPDEKAIYS